MYVNVCRGVFRTQQIIYVGAFLRKSQKSFIVDVRLGSKYASGVSFIVERFAECQYLSYIAKVNFAKVKNLSLIFLFLELIKNMLV